MAVVLGARVDARTFAVTSERAASWAAFFAVTACLTALFGFGDLRGNEYDVLPVAKQFADSHWLAGDWYLNLPIRYRYAFNLPVGFALRVLPLPMVVLVGRIAVCALFAAACVSLFRAFRVSLWLCVPCIFLFLLRQDLVAREWMVKSFETKPFAYGAALLALADLQRRRYAAVAVWLALAVLFHVLVGGYAVLCTLSCLGLAEHRPDVRRLYRRWKVALYGAIGVALAFAVWGLARHSDARVAAQGAEIYVTFRVPHHVYPGAWSSRSWGAWFVLCLLLCLMLRFTRVARQRLLAQYALSAAAFFVFGLLLFKTNQVTLLRFYWFRFGDTMLPFLGWFSLALLTTDAMARWRSSPSIRARTAQRCLRVTFVGLTALLPCLCLVPYALSKPVRLHRYEIPIRRAELPGYTRTSMGQWIRAHTSKQACFVVDPSLETFYLDAERPVFVSFKHSPQSEADIVEWYRRIVLLNGGTPPRTRGFAALAEFKESYAHLDAAHVRDLMRAYPVDYLLTTQQLPFPVVHKDAMGTLYQLRAAGPNATN